MFHILTDMFDGFFFSKTFSCFWNFIFSPNFVVDGKNQLDFFKRKNA
jgi:hypothetical protein